MMYNSVYLASWRLDVPLAGKRNKFLLNNSYRQVPKLAFALPCNAPKSCVEELCRRCHRMMASNLMTA